jgi:DMSO/TMAO reductase YedYZ molybdopterin-dependent catalytic subunit
VLAVTDLERLGAVDVEWSVHGDAHAFRGVPLHAVLEHMGFTEGPGGSALPPTERRSGWRWVVQVWASDGFSAAFSAAELSPVMGATRAFLVWSQDGEPIPVAEGPLRLVVPSDRKGARCVRQVDRLTVVDLRGRTGRR